MLIIIFYLLDSLNNNITNLLKTNIAIINNLTYQVKTINNILLLQQLDNNQVLFNKIIFLIFH